MARAALAIVPILALLSLAALASIVSVSTQTLQAQQGYLTVVYFESAPASGKITINTQLSTPTSGGSYSISTRPGGKAGPAVYICSSPFSSQAVVPSGEALVVVYAKAGSSGLTLSLTLEVVKGNGKTVAMLGSASITLTSTSEKEYVVPISVSSATIPKGDYLALALSLSGTSKGSVTIYYGTSGPTNFQVAMGVESA